MRSLLRVFLKATLHFVKVLPDDTNKYFLKYPLKTYDLTDVDVRNFSYKTLFGPINWYQESFNH